MAGDPGKMAASQEKINQLKAKVFDNSILIDTYGKKCGELIKENNALKKEIDALEGKG